jgi:vacuolar protein sorting-associated protein 54
MKLELHELLSVTSLAFEFVTSLEKLSGRSCFALRSTLLSQQKAFLEHLQEKNLNNLAAALDCEKWTQSDITPERQAAIDRLAAGQGAILNPAIVSSSNGQISSSSSSASSSGGVSATSGSSAPSKSKKGKQASEVVFNNGRYKVVWSCLLLIEMVSGLLNTCAAFPMLASDVHSRVVEVGTTNIVWD